MHLNLRLKCYNFNQGLIGSASTKMLKGKFQEGTVELIWSQEPSITVLHFSFGSDLFWHQASEPCFRYPSLKNSLSFY